VLQSTLLDFENVLLNDGCAGITVLDRKEQIELRFDEHKLLIFYNWRILGAKLFEVLKRYGIQKCPDIKFITDFNEHMHSTSNALKEEFEQLAYRLGAEEID
jgi:hypothetical protein